MPLLDSCSFLLLLFCKISSIAVLGAWASVSSMGAGVFRFFVGVRFVCGLGVFSSLLLLRGKVAGRSVLLGLAFLIAFLALLKTPFARVHGPGLVVARDLAIVVEKPALSVS